MSSEALGSQALAAAERCNDRLKVARETLDRMMVDLLCDEDQAVCQMTRKTVAVVTLTILKQFEEIQGSLELISSCTKETRQRSIESEKIIENLEKLLQEKAETIQCYQSELDVKQSILCRLTRELEQSHSQLWLQVAIPTLL
eukprot:768351-Hanusia_phi.AAC.7